MGNITVCKRIHLHYLYKQELSDLTPLFIQSPKEKKKKILKGLPIFHPISAVGFSKGLKNGRSYETPEKI